MKQFNGNRPLPEIVRNARQQGVRVQLSQWRRGSDYVKFETKRDASFVLYNTFNGRFFGETSDGTSFSSDEGKWDKYPWFQALLNFFYTDKEPAAKKPTNLEYTVGRLA